MVNVQLMTNYKIYRFWTFILFISSMYSWFTFTISTSFITIPSLFIFYKCYKSDPNIFNAKINKIFAFISLLFFLNLCRNVNIFGVINYIIIWVCLLGYMSLNTKYKYDIIKYITEKFAILLAISLVVYILYAFGVPLPHTSLSYGIRYEFNNYYFFLQRDNVMRFHSIFLEPGHMTMGLAPLLFINNYNLKNKYVAILFISQLLSLSLAGYIVLVIGYLLSLFINSDYSRKIQSIVLIISSFVAFLIVCTMVWKDFSFQEAILNRLIFEDGTLSGYNRTGEAFDYFYDHIMSTDDKWFGVSWKESDFDHGVAGYKRFVVTSGLVGLILSLLLYLMPIFITFKKDSVFLVIILLLLLFQNAYPDWWCLLIILCCGINYMEINKNENALYTTFQ